MLIIQTFTWISVFNALLKTFQNQFSPHKVDVLITVVCISANNVYNHMTQRFSKTSLHINSSYPLFYAFINQTQCIKIKTYIITFGASMQVRGTWHYVSFLYISNMYVKIRLMHIHSPVCFSGVMCCQMPSYINIQSGKMAVLMFLCFFKILLCILILLITQFK